MSAIRKIDALPRRGLKREEAAHYVGVGTTLFDEMVKDGRMPKPISINSRKLWDLKALDFAFDQLPDNDDEANQWNNVD